MAGVGEYEGATLTDHWVRSPVLMLKDGCLACHQKHDANVNEQQLKDRVEEIRDPHWKLRQDAMTALMGLIEDLKAARAAGKSDADLKAALYLHRQAQFYLDFIEAENSGLLPCAAGVSPHSRRIDQFLSPGPDRGA